MGEPRSAGFAPVAGPAISTLILGSLPSRRSIAAGQYYGHPRNAFWPIMGELFDAGPDRPYPERTARLVAAGVGLWDVLASSVRPGSMDSAIEIGSATPNDFDAFLRGHPGVRRIFFNGRKAAELFARMRCLESRAGTIEYATLPSTSPAFAAMPFDEKLAQWSVVIPTSDAVR